jgi:hypothetical protein
MVSSRTTGSGGKGVGFERAKIFSRASNQLVSTNLEAKGLAAWLLRDAFIGAICY